MTRWLWLDMLGKVQEEVVVRTTASSIVTIIVWIVIPIVIFGEVNYYLNPQSITEVGIDRTGIEKMQIDFSIRLPELPCPNFGVDALDSSGNMLLEVRTNIRKENLTTSRGCLVVGKLDVNKVAGEFHIGFGRDSEAVHHEGLDSMEGNHIHRFTMKQAKDFNTTHKIEHIGFTVPDQPSNLIFRLIRLKPSSHAFPLNGHYELVPNNSARFLYFINVVAFSNSKWGHLFYGYEYSWRSHKIPVDTSLPRFWQPGLFFKYELEPYVMNYKMEQRSLIETVLRCVATVGGIYVVAGWISSLLYYIRK